MPRSWTVAASHQTHHAQVQSLAISQDETLLVRIIVMEGLFICQ